MTARCGCCRHDCPLCACSSALALAESGRHGMALAVLRAVPGLVEDALEAAYQRGAADGRRAAARAKPPRPEPPAGGNGRPAFRRQGAELLEAADVLGVQRVAAVLGVRVADLLPLIAGTVEVSRTALAKLRREVSDDVSF